MKIFIVAKKIFRIFLYCMKIQSINYNYSNYGYFKNLKSTTPSFGSNSRALYSKEGKLLYRTTTNFFRPDLDWERFGIFLREKYAHALKVNMLCYGCSDGSETLSILMMLKEFFGKDAKRFLPIVAKDIDKTVLYLAKSGSVEMDYHDHAAINRFTNNKFNDYFEQSNFVDIIDNIPVKLKAPLKKGIEYSYGNIMDDILSIPRKNTVLFCRNFWPYLKSPQERYKLALDLSSRLQDNCTLVIGSYDRIADVHFILSSAGFRRVKNLTNVYESGKSKLPDTQFLLSKCVKNTNQE